MKKITIGGLLKMSPSVYKLTNMAIKRVLELSKQTSHADTGKHEGPITIALNEILEGKISYKPHSGKK